MENTNVAFTENGALSLASTTDPRVDLFFKTTRDVGVLETGDIEEGGMGANRALYNMIDAAMASYPLDAIKILMNWRDCRGGKGDYRGFIVAMTYIHQKYPKWFQANFEIIPEYGSFLDLVKLWHYVNQDMQLYIAVHFLEVLTKDVEKMRNNEPVSLLAKWFPSENSKWDKLPTGSAGSLYKTMCKLTNQNSSPSCRAWLRKEYLGPLRKHLKIVESKMCAKEFDQIEYSAVPSVAMQKYKKAFTRNDRERFSSYLSKVATGEAKINASQVYPHDLVRQYLNGKTQEDPVIEAQWKVLKETAQKTGAFDNSIVVCDVSGSMDGTPMEVAIALGLLGLYDNKLITFSESPQLHYVPDGTLYEQVQNVRKMAWGCNTNFERVMDLVLGLSARDRSNAIKRIYIFSDMQFDTAMGNNTKTHFVHIQERFKTAGVELPQIVFWNLRGATSDFPVTFDQNGVVLMAGYSPSLLQSLLDGQDITPLSIVKNIITSPRYDLVKAPTQHTI